MKGYKETTGANLRLVSRNRKEKKQRIFNAALRADEQVDRSASRKMLDSYFQGPTEEEKDSTKKSLLISLVVVLISFYIVWPSFMETLEIQKEPEEVQLTAGGYSAPPPQAKKIEKREVKRVETMVPQLYPEIEELELLAEERIVESTEQDWADLSFNGEVGNADFGLEGSGGGPVYDAGAGGVVPEPELLYKVEPDYPEPARRARVDGFVLLKAIINKQGDVVDVKVLQSPAARYGFAEKAIEAVQKWKFKPSIYKGKAVSVSIRFSVDFNLVY